MLQRYSVQEQAPYEETSFFLTPDFFNDIIKRRLLYFVIPFVVVAAVGTGIVALLPAVYLSEGKILVESQQIPSELVRSTVTALANERIQVIEQRIMTRDNLLSLANKFQMFSGRNNKMSNTDMLDFIRERTQIRPHELKLPKRANSNLTIAFTVGFEHENPAIAMRVANELVTMILSEDVRVRTAFATETTRFLERESQRLDTELRAVEIKIAELKRKQFRMPETKGRGSPEGQLVALKAELLERAAKYSDAHPDMKAIKAKIAALESALVPSKETDDGKAAVATDLGIDALERQEAALQKNLETTNLKLSAARLGESLERGQQSERLEIIEQPALPQNPIKPKRPKFYAMALAAALAAGGGLVVMLEMFQSTIFRRADLIRVVDSHLIVTIPHIATKADLYGRKKKVMLSAAIGVLLLLVAVVIALLLLPPLDLVFNKLFVVLGI